MDITISGGKKATKASDPVTVTIGTTADLGRGQKYPNAIAIQFTGTECHVIQIFMRTKVVSGKAVTDTIGRDSGGFNTFKFSEVSAPDWLVDTTSASSPYYDFGYAGKMVGKDYIMVDAPTMVGGKYDLPGRNDVTTFDAYCFCISDKNVIAVVHWNMTRHYWQVAVPSANLVTGQAWFDRFDLGRRTLSKEGYGADLYLPNACIK
jgi:hypothetical protein